MKRLTHFTRKASLAALLAATVLPGVAYAGDQTNAEAAIAEAKGKIDAGEKVGVSDQAPELQAQAREELMSAEAKLSHHHKREAIATAHHASELADQALVAANDRKALAERARRDDIRDSAAVAQQSAVNANIRADSAQQAMTMANMRADSAERDSASANAQADALRNAPPPAATQTTTTLAVTQHDTVTTKAAPIRHHHRRVAHKRARTAHVRTTTTVVTTTHP